MENNPSAYNEHPLREAGLPDWLASVPMEVVKPTLVDVGGGKTISAEHIMTAVSGEVGVIYGSMSIVPELANRVSEFTENSSWTNLPTEPTSIKRLDDDSWRIRVGDYEATFDREALASRLSEALGDSLEE